MEETDVLKINGDDDDSRCLKQLLSSNAFQKMSQKLLADHKIKLNYEFIMNKLILIK